MQRTIQAMAWVCSLMLVQVATAQVQTRTEKIGERQQMVLENSLVKLAVLPDPGGTVIEFLHKPSNTNYVAGGDKVLAGRLGWGWKDYYALEGVDALGKWVFSLPYRGEFREGPGYKSIYVTVDCEGRRFEREMRLSDHSAEVTVLIKVTNISDKPLRLQCRWHTYSTLDDIYAENSCIIAPDKDGQARKAFIGSGWDHQFVTADGYWLAVNYKNGLGMWMTFKKEQSSMQITWTDYNHTRRAPTRGAFIAEPHPQSILGKPGESVAYECTFYPFTGQDAPASIPMGMLSPPEQARAKQFLADVLPNLAVIGPYTMTPGAPPAGIVPLPGAENRFSFSHRRRDRFTVRNWGILDAMMAVAGVQDQTIRCRYYARLFDRMPEPKKVTFRLRAIDQHGKVAQEQSKDFVLSPSQREVDVRDDVAISGLPDGWYQFVLQGLVEGESEPVHTYIEQRQLVGQQRAAYDKALAERESGPLVERPFVAALRTVAIPEQRKDQVSVPIGVEDGSGIARKDWPVRGGVPFAQGLIAKDAAFELLDPAGKPVPLQTEVMATWMDGSVKWLLADFQANVPADGHVFYTLKAGPAAKTKAPATAPALSTDEVLAIIRPEGMWWDDGSGQRFTFRMEGENAGITQETDGHNRQVHTVTGWYVNGQGQPAAMGELRIEQYRGQSFLRVFHTVTYAGDPWRQTLGSYGLTVQLPGKGYSSATVELDGKTVSGKKIVLHQRRHDAAEVTTDGAASSGRRSSGAVQLAGSGGPVTVYAADLWHMAPKKLEVDAAAGALTLHYWPKEAGAMSFLPREDGWIPSSSSAEAIAVGMGRTHEWVIDLGGRAAVTDCQKLYSEPVVAIAPPRYLAQTKAMMHLSPYDPQRHPTMEKVISNTIDFYESQRQLWGWYGQWTYGGIPNFWSPTEYRWLDFGRYAWILNEQDIVEAPWLCYLRSGDRKYLKFAESNTRHLMEVATIRWNPVWPQYVGLSRRHHECIWLSGGDTGHSMLDPFLDYYYATGYQPARDAARRMGGAMAQVNSGTWRYISNPVAGLSRLYLDTQNPLYKQHADRIWETLCYPEKNDWWTGDHGDRMAMWYSQVNPQMKQAWKEFALNAEKKDRLGNPDSLTALWLESGEARYAEAAAKGLPGTRPMEITQHVLSKLRAWCYLGHLPPPAPAK